MTEEELILAAAEAIQATKSPEYAERAANIAEARERLAAMEAEQEAIDEAAADAKAQIYAPKVAAGDFDIPRVNVTRNPGYEGPSADEVKTARYINATVNEWTPRDDHEIFAVPDAPEADPVHYELPHDDDEFTNSARPNGALE